ncbi:MAG TPA: nitroreductase family protein [Ktedonosporobacter sp.]|nr:nitroreductase family protein [Ktedonosporobacter sp.]
MPQLNLSSDQLLTTTRSVRKRLDFSRPVEPEVIRECLEIALQAPTGGNRQEWQFVIVTDAEKRKVIGDFYRQSFARYRIAANEAAKRMGYNAERAHTQMRVSNSADYLAEHFHEAPVHLIPCIRGRLEGSSTTAQAGAWGSILPATWSFMLAARDRGLGSAWTTLHLPYEKEVAELLGIPYDQITQAALLPIAYTLGTDFKPALREPLDTILHWNNW